MGSLYSHTAASTDGDTNNPNKHSYTKSNNGAQQAEKSYRRAIDAGDTDALNNLAVLLQYGDEVIGVQKDVWYAEVLYRRASDNGHTGALSNLALLLLNGDEEGGVQKDARQAESLYRRAINAGNTNALFNLANLLQDGDEAGGVEKDARQAEALYRRAIDAGHTRSLFNLALLLHEGDEAGGVEKDSLQAEALYRRAIDVGDSHALVNLAVLLQRGDEPGGVQKDVQQAESLYHHAIAVGDTDALLNLAVLLQHGDKTGGVEKDSRQAETLYRRAIDAGNTDALLNLANLLRDGSEEGVVQKDIRQAKALYCRAIDAGNTDALIGLANLLRRNDDVDSTKSFTKYTEIVTLFDRAVERGNFRACAYRGLMFQRGAAGLQINTEAAVVSFRRGWERGDMFSGYLLARSLLEDKAGGMSLFEAEEILQTVRNQCEDCSALATHELAVLYERGRGPLRSNPSRASDLHHCVMENLQNGSVRVPYASDLILKSGPRYALVIDHVLQTGEATPKKCLLLTLGGAARGKSSTVRSMKHMTFEKSHKKTMMADVFEFVSSPGDGQLEDGLVKDIDFNESSLRASIMRYERGMGNIRELEAIARSPCQSLADSDAIVQRNAQHPQIDVIEQIRRAMVVSEYGSGFKRAAVTVWDMGGQDEYEMSHSLFIDRANILVFVTNLARVENESTRWSEVQLLAYWIKFSYMLLPEPEKVATFVVATHKHTCQGEEHTAVLRRLTIELKSTLKELIWTTWFGSCKRGQIPDNCVAVENSISERDRGESGLEHLEELIQQAADKIVGERSAVQIRWLALIDKLSRLGEGFYPRRRVLDICEGFPGFPTKILEKERDILNGLRALASMGKLVLFEMGENNWYVFMSVERTVRFAGAIVSAVNDPTVALTDAELQELKSGIVDEYVLSEIWGNTSAEEQEVMRDLLISFDHLIDLDGGASGNRSFGVPALLRCGALNLKWGPRDGFKQLYAISTFDDVIPSGFIGGLMAFLHRTVSSGAPPATLVRQNVALLTVKNHGQVFVEFDRRRNELTWIFLSPAPQRLAQLCFQELDNLLTNNAARWQVASRHDAKTDCPPCAESNCLSVELDRGWINRKNLSTTESKNLPDLDIFCPHCRMQWRSSELNWYRRHTGLDVHEMSPLASLLAVDKSKRYNVFISHAGPDKVNLAYPIYRSLERLGLRCFLDFKSLETGPRTAPAEMDDVMNDAPIGIFILSPEFATRKWTMRELGTFLSRHRTEHEGSIILHPVFYKLTTEDCSSFYQTDVQSDGNHKWCGKYSQYLEESRFVRQYLEKNGSVSQLQRDLSAISAHTGSIMEPPGLEKLSDAGLKENIIDSVINAARKLKML